MSSYCFGGTIKLIPNEKENEKDEFEDKYSLEIPDVKLECSGEEYHPQHAFTWVDDSIILKRKNHTIKYSKCHFSELYAIDESGEKVWIDGRRAPYDGCWGGIYLGEIRDGFEFSIEEYDSETLTKTEYIAKKVKTEPMNDYEIGEYINIKNTNNEENNRKIIIDNIKNDWNNYKDIPLEYKKDLDFNLELVNTCWNVNFIQFIDKSIKDNPDFIISTLKKKGNALEFFSDEIKNNKEIVKLAINNDGKSYKFISDELKKDKELITLALTKRCDVKLIDKSILLDKKFVLELIKLNDEIIEFLDDSFKDDKEIFEVGLSYSDYKSSIHFHPFQYASDRLKDDEELVKKAIFTNGELLYWVSDRLKHNKEIALIALSNSIDALEYIPEDLQADKDIIDIVLRKGYRGIQYFTNKDVVMSLVEKDKSLEKFIPYQFRNNNAF